MFIFFWKESTYMGIYLLILRVLSKSIKKNVFGLSIEV